MTAETAGNNAADTIVLIHGLWMTPRSWEHWVPYYQSKGYNVLTPTYPGFEVEVEALRADPTPIADSSIASITNHLAEYIGKLEKPPILIGHSFGGTLVQLLLDRGLGVAGVAIDSAPTEGVLVSPPSQMKSVFKVLKNPLNHSRAVGFTPAEFHYAFTNTMTDEESEAVYDRYHIPAPGRIVWDGVLGNLIPGKQDAYVNFNNDERAPLLFIAGSEDNIMPPAVNQSNFKHYANSKAVTDYHEFPGRCHFICGQEGWEEVADYAIEWAGKSHEA